jgi:hypothetical protein
MGEWRRKVARDHKGRWFPLFYLLLKKANNIKIILEKNKTLREKKILNLLIILRKIIAWEEHEDEHSVIFTGLAKSPETGLTIIEELDHLPEDYRQRTKELLENNVSLMDNFRVPLMKKMKKTLSELESVV